MVVQGGGRLNGLALCSGYGGLELALERFFPGYRTVCHVEGEAFAVSHLIKKMDEGRIHQAPVWDDVRTFNGEPWRGKVDIIAGGFPCQPFSNAGKQLGDKDDRHLWPFIVQIVRQVRPRFLFFENVPGVVKWILDDILLDLASMGYNASWCVVRAGDIGAPHQRARWFIWAELSIPNTNRQGVERISSENGNTKAKKPGKGKLNSIDKWGGGFDSWWKVEPSMGRLVDGASDWVDKLRILGNGVVPQQAHYALTILTGVMNDN